MMKSVYTVPVLLGICINHTSSLLPSAHHQQHNQEEIFSNALNTQHRLTADALSLCSHFPILRNYESMRSLLENRNDLLLPGNNYTHPPAVFAIETQNTPLLRAILDVACPHTITHTGCTQIPPHAAVIHNNTNALREILFPTRIPATIEQSLQYIPYIPNIIESYVGRRATPDVLSLTNNISLFEIALYNNNVDNLNVLRDYLRHSYQQSTVPQRQIILQWLHNRCHNLDRPQPEFDKALTWITIGSLFILLGIADQVSKSLHDNKAPHTTSILPSAFFFLGGTGFLLVGCSATQYLRMNRRRYGQEQIAITFYRDLVHNLPRT